MARSFAGIMGLLGMIVVLLRAVKGGSGLETAVPQALLWTMMLTIVGAIVGAIAERTVDESVRAKLEEELAAISEEAVSD